MSAPGPSQRRPTDNWGHSARFGIFIVGSEVVPEAEWWAMAPAGVSVHAARVTAPAPWALWNADRTAVRLVSDVERGASQFATMKLSAVVVAHSSSSIAGGSGWDDAVALRLSEVLGPSTATTTNGRDCIMALQKCGVRRPFLVFPPWFSDAALMSGAAYFKAHGFEDPTFMRQCAGTKWASVRPEDLYRSFMHIEQSADALRKQVVDRCPATADGVLIVGTGLRCVASISDLETTLNRPVVTANQASLWRCLDLANVKTPVLGYGRLLEGC